MFENFLAVRPKDRLKAFDLFRRELDDVDRIFDNMLKFHGTSLLKGIDNPIFSPSLDIVEKEDKYVATIELSGIKKEDLNIHLNNGSLIISGEKKQENKEEKDSFIVSERSYGMFKREIPLPENIIEENVEAIYNKEGVLIINIPKQEIKQKEKLKKIEIKTT